MPKLSRAEKARNTRHRRAALAIMQRDTLEDELYAIQSECNDLEWAVEDDETLIDVFDGDADEIYEFRMMFSDLSAKCQRLYDRLSDECVNEHFDDYFVGALGSAYSMVGYDSVEEDYYHLTRYEAELAHGASGKRLMGITKERIIAVGGQCVGVMMCFLDIRHSYDCLKATLDLLRDDRAELLKNVRTFEDAYQKTQATDWRDREAVWEFDDLLSRLPSRVWVE